MRTILIAACVSAVSACSAGVEGLTGDAGARVLDAAPADARGAAALDADALDAAALDADALDATPGDDGGATLDSGVDAGQCAPVILSEADEDVTSAALVPDGTGWRIFRGRAGAQQIVEQRLDATGQATQPAGSAGVGPRVDAHFGGGGYAVVFGGTVLIGPTPELRVSPNPGDIIAYRRQADGQHTLARHSADQIFVDLIQPGGAAITVSATPAARWREVYAAALSPTELAIVGTTTASDAPLSVQIRAVGADLPWSAVQLPTVLASSDAARVVWHEQRNEWLVAHSVQRAGTRYGDPHVTFLTGPRATVRLQQPLGPWGAWYGAPIAVATTDVGYALAWQTAEDIGGGSSGFNDYLLAAELAADDSFTAESAAPFALAATGRLPPQVAWNPATGDVGRLWIHRVGAFPPGTGHGQLVFQCGRR